MLGAISIAACASVGGDQGVRDRAARSASNVVAKDYAFDTTRAHDDGEPAHRHLLHEPRQRAARHRDLPDQGRQRGMFDGEIIDHGSIVYDVPAFDAGTYFFKCTVHPIMYGTVQVTP